MATPGATTTDVSDDRSVIRSVWTLTTTDHTGQPVRAIEFENTTFQAVGTFGGCTVIIEGSLDGTNFYALRDITGTGIALTSAGLQKVLESVQYIRPRLSVVGTGASITATLLCRQKINTRTS